MKCTDDSSWQVILDKLCIDAKKVEEDDDDDTIFQCTLCSDHITFPDLSHLHFHMFHHHSEEFFQSAKQPHLSNEQFQKFCTTLFEAHTKMARDMSALQRQVDWDDKANAGALSSCPFGCSDFLFDNENFLTVHLIKVHHKNVREKLRDLQREHAVT